MIRTPDIQAALRLRFCAPEWALMFEVGQGTGSNSGRYADAVAMNLYPSRGLELHGFEIKVSRGDWQRELKNPEKAEAISQYCERWWIAAPKELVKKEELPVTWGLIELDGKALRVAVQAPLLSDRKPLSRPFIAALLRRSSEIDQAIVDRLVETRVSEFRERQREQIDKAVEAKTRFMREKLDRVEAVEKAAGISFTDWSANAEMGLAIKAILSAGMTSIWGGLDQLEKQLRGHADRLKADIEAFKSEASMPEPMS